jgi:hypothetical protein
MPRPLLSFLLFAVALGARAQHTDTHVLIAADLEAVNTHFAGLARFAIDKQDRLVVDLFQDGARYRQDVVYVEFLDPAAFAFVAEEQAVVLKCADGHARCIDKEILKLDTISHTGRTNLPLPANDADGAQALALLGKLVRDKQTELRGR